MKCPKCGFDSADARAGSCPRCGVVFAKVQRAKEEEAAYERRLAAERAISDVVEKQMETAEEIRARLEPDIEYARDEQAYPLANLLADVFAFLAVFTAIVEIMGMVWFYNWGKTIFSQRDMILFMASWVIASVGSVAVLLAISVGLRIGRDATNHLRAMREYLRREAGDELR